MPNKFNLKKANIMTQKIYKTLRQLYQEHQGKVSDKWSIYLDEYERVFSSLRNYPIRLLEIGIQNGGSLEIWSKYFTNAVKLVGCDINHNCRRLTYDNSSIALVVADANLDKTESIIHEHAPTYDLIIDDGSHRSSDIVKSFARYFPHLSDGGLFIVEDLHCSYWQEFEGGLFDSYSSIAFFKQLVDVINHEHWGADKSRNELLAGFVRRYDISFKEELLAQIHSIEFINSMCIIRKDAPINNQSGRRIIAGQQTLVLEVPKALSEFCIPPDQSSNPMGAGSMQFEADLSQLCIELAERARRIAMQDKQLSLQNERIELVLNSRSWKVTAPLRRVAQWLGVKNK